MSEKPVLAVIGGSGMYEFPSLTDTEKFEIDTPYGQPSSPIIVGSLEGRRVAFLARHGIGHKYLPSEVNYRANIYALKKIGVSRILSISACGSLREDYSPGHIVIPDQVMDHTHSRARTFFGNGIVAHIGSADPFCADLSNILFQALLQTSATVHKGGTYITIEGPSFSTKAESNLYREWGMSVIGMTACPEIFLAREAEMCYTTMAHVTDYDVWHVSEEPVTVEMVVKVLMQNTKVAQEAVVNLIKLLPEEDTCGCHSILKDAIMTNKAVISPDTLQRVNLLVEKYIK